MLLHCSLACSRAQRKVKMWCLVPPLGHCLCPTLSMVDTCLRKEPRQAVSFMLSFLHAGKVRLKLGRLKVTPQASRPASRKSSTGSDRSAAARRSGRSASHGSRSRDPSRDGQFGKRTCSRARKWLGNPVVIQCILKRNI